jgi:hypothetical protein
MYEIFLILGVHALSLGDFWTKFRDSVLVSCSILRWNFLPLKVRLPHLSEMSGINHPGTNPLIAEYGDLNCSIPKT